MRIPPVRKPSPEVLARVHSLKAREGMIAAIKPESGSYFLGRTLLEALKKARAQYPTKVFYSIRIGSPYAHEHKGGIPEYKYQTQGEYTMIDSWITPNLN